MTPQPAIALITVDPNDTIDWDGPPVDKTARPMRTVHVHIKRIEKKRPISAQSDDEQAILSEMKSSPYPWYGLIPRGSEIIEQGDLLFRCPVLSPLGDLPDDVDNIDGEVIQEDVVVMSQSCDLAVRERRKGRPPEPAISHVMLCPFYCKDELELVDLNDINAGRRPPFHLLAYSEIPGFERGLRIVDFRTVYSLPIDFIRRRLRASDHLRVLPPYREHLAQSFARFFMRVGLPSDLEKDDMQRITP